MSAPLVVFAVGNPSRGDDAIGPVICGRLAINDQILATGDAAKIADETRLAFQADEETEFLLFDLPPLN